MLQGPPSSLLWWHVSRRRGCWEVLPASLEAACRKWSAGGSAISRSPARVARQPLRILHCFQQPIPAADWDSATSSGSVATAAPPGVSGGCAACLLGACVFAFSVPPTSARSRRLQADLARESRAGSSFSVLVSPPASSPATFYSLSMSVVGPCTSLSPLLPGSSKTARSYRQHLRVGAGSIEGHNEKAKCTEDRVG
jgi:hypothetical protein